MPDHFHAFQEEHFEVISGNLMILLEGNKQVLPQGEKLTLPKNKQRNHYNADNETVVLIHSVIPALDFDYLLKKLLDLPLTGKYPMENRVNPGIGNLKILGQ